MFKNSNEEGSYKLTNEIKNSSFHLFLTFILII